MDENVKHALGDAIGPSLFGMLSPIRTVYKGGKERHSGTGLMIAAEENRVVCLTALHVVDPTRRTDAVRQPVLSHRHTQPLALDRDIPQVCFRNKYCGSRSYDLAILESAQSQTDSAMGWRTHYFPYEAAISGRDFVPSKSDTLFLAGFPSRSTLELPVPPQAGHTGEIHFFAGHHIHDPSENASVFEIAYIEGRSPHGLSGSPVWCIRSSDAVESTFTPRIEDALTWKSEKFLLLFCGVAASYDPDTNSILAIKPKICVNFLKDALARLA